MTEEFLYSAESIWLLSETTAPQLLQRTNSNIIFHVHLDVDASRACRIVTVTKGMCPSTLTAPQKWGILFWPSQPLTKHTCPKKPNILPVLSSQKALSPKFEHTHAMKSPNPVEEVMPSLAIPVQAEEKKHTQIKMHTHCAFFMYNKITTHPESGNIPATPCWTDQRHQTDDWTQPVDCFPQKSAQDLNNSFIFKS